jgi:hypothetical protein
MAITATPRNPNPNKPAKDGTNEVEPVNVDEELGRDLPGDDPVVEGQGEDGERNRPEDVREMRLTRRMFDKHGWSDDCPGCDALQRDAAKRKHTPVCRERMYRRMEEDPGDRETLTKALMRQPEFQARPSAIPEGVESEKNDPGPQESAPRNAEPRIDAPRTAAPHREVDELFGTVYEEAAVEENPELPDGEADEDVMEEANHEISEDDVAQMTDSEDDEATRNVPTNDNKAQQRPREDDAKSANSAQARVKRRRTDDQNDGDPSNDHLLSLEEAFEKVNMAKIIQELEQDPRLKLKNGNRRQKAHSKNGSCQGHSCGGLLTSESGSSGTKVGTVSRDVPRPDHGR